MNLDHSPARSRFETTGGVGQLMERQRAGFFHFLKKPEEKFVICGDPHGEVQSGPVVLRFLKFLDEFKPEIVVHGGDNWNFTHLRMKASDEDQSRDDSDDWRMGTDFFKTLFDYGNTRLFMRGNHDERLWKHTEHRKAAVRGYAFDGVKRIERLCRKHRVKMLPYSARRGVAQVGSLRIIHGYAHGIGAPNKFARAYGNCCYLHTHSMEIGVVEHWPYPSVAYGAGCLCQIDQEYNEHQMGKLRHENGWAYGVVREDGVVLFQSRATGGGFYVAERIRRI